MSVNTFPLQVFDFGVSLSAIVLQDGQFAASGSYNECRYNGRASNDNGSNAGVFNGLFFDGWNLQRAYKYNRRNLQWFI